VIGRYQQKTTLIQTSSRKGIPFILGGFAPGVATQNRQRFWTKPHFIAVDEPTNYLDVETVEALSKALMGG